MDIFISWSGERSRKCAEALNTWLPRVIQSVRPWISTHDIAKGTRWESILSKQLGQHIYGIICVTPENRESPWLNYEAGALSKTDSSRTFTLLIGLNHADVEQPLAQFNHTLARKPDMLALIRSINESSETHLPEDLLTHSFEINWKFMEDEFATIIAEAPPEAKKPKPTSAGPREDRSLLEEILETVRAQSKAIVRSNIVQPDATSPRALIHQLVKAELDKYGFLGTISVKPVSPQLYRVSLDLPGALNSGFMFSTKKPKDEWHAAIASAIEDLIRAKL